MRHVVRLLLILLDVIAVALPQHLPIEMPRVIAGDVLAVLRKLDGKPTKRRPVCAGHVALDHRPRLQAQMLRALDGDGIEERVLSSGSGHRCVTV